MAEDKGILVLGIGNVLWADEGFGIRAVEALNAAYAFPKHVTLLDGGTQGVYLVEHVRTAGRLLVFDAIDYGLAPGTLKVVRDDEVPRFMGVKKMSLHQTGFQEVLATAQLLGGYPDELVLIGAQPEELDDYGGSLRDVVKAQIPAALDIAVRQLAAWGVTGQPRLRASAERLNAPALDIGAYESERPTAEQACRIGDARVLAERGGR